jgi:hypothetical protein
LMELPETAGQCRIWSSLGRQTGWGRRLMQTPRLGFGGANAPDLADAQMITFAVFEQLDVASTIFRRRCFEPSRLPKTPKAHNVSLGDAESRRNAAARKYQWRRK